MIAAVKRARRPVSQIVAWGSTLFAWTCRWCSYVHLIVRSRKAATTATTTMIHSNKLAAAGTYFHIWPEVVVSKPPEKCCSKAILERLVANPHARQEEAIAIGHGSLDQIRTPAPLPWLMAKVSFHEIKEDKATWGLKVCVVMWFESSDISGDEDVVHWQRITVITLHRHWTVRNGTPQWPGMEGPF